MNRRFETDANKPNIIPPEIKNDEFYYLIEKLSAEEDLNNVLEIGSSSGDGSTEAFVTGLRKNKNKPKLFCMEIDEDRFNKLKATYDKDDFVKCYNFSSVMESRLPNNVDVLNFYDQNKTNLNNYPIEKVLSWLSVDKANIKKGKNVDGIQLIKKENSIENFDLVLIDGSAFTGEAELSFVYGAKIILLDDINDYKNFNTYHKLKDDPNYFLVHKNISLRNGFAIFAKRGEKYNLINIKEDISNQLPVHFFTIVLNGKPFIEYHINVFKDLPFEWHWHIIEGVADLINDTAWSLPNGGHISDELHNKGLSNDGTTEYIDDIKNQFPDNITIYRKSEGEFWNGKLEMINAPLENLRSECILWEIDADELWTAEQLIQGRQLYINNPRKTASFYLCSFFVGEKLLISSINTYGNHTDNEWLRTWRYKPGDKWLSHEPPKLCRLNGAGDWKDLGKVDPFTISVTKAHKLVFQHYAYVLPEQLTFKEKYYGYHNALSQWEKLQEQTKFPVMLRDYFSWVTDEAIVDRSEKLVLHNLAIKSDGKWTFDYQTGKEKPYKKILFLRIDSIGDNVLSASMLPKIKRKFPNTSFTVLCQKHIAELYDSTPFVDRIITINKQQLLEEQEYRDEFFRKLKKEEFDIVLHSIYSRELLGDIIVANINSPIKVGFEGDLNNISKEDKEITDGVYTHLIPLKDSFKNELEKYKDFLSGIGIECDNLTPSIWLTEEDSNYADKVFSENNLKSEKTIALFAGAQHEVRIYNDYGKAINNYCNKNEFEVVVLGSTKDHRVNQVNIKDLTVKVVDLTGKTTIRQSAAILQKCAAAIGAETGLAHIACAVGTPNLILLGGGHFGRFMPYSNLTSIVSLPLECFGCNWQCKYQTITCIKEIDYQVISVAIENMMTQDKKKTTVYLQSEYKHDFLAELPKITGIENFLKGEFEVKVIELETTDVSHDFTDNISKFKDEKYFIALTRLEKLFNLNGTNFKQYVNYEKQLFTEKNKFELLFESDLNNYVGDPFYNYLKGLFNEHKKNFEASYENYLLSFKSGKNLRVLNKLAQVADKNFVIPQVYLLFKELFQRGIKSSEILKKINNWVELLNVKSVNKLTQINYNIDLPSEYLNDLEINKKKPTISFVLPSKNRSKGLSSFLLSLDNACFGLSYEVLLYCGDELTEQYDKLIKEYNIKKIFFDKEIFSVQKTFSWTKLMNHGFNNSDGQWIMYASDDIVLHPFACNFALQSVKDKTIGGVSFLHRNTIQDYDGFFKDYGFDIYGEKLFINFGLIRKEAFQKVKGFDENLKFYSGDADICWRIIDSGFKIIPSYYSLVEHINIEDSTKGLNSDKIYKIDTYTFFKKWLNQINQFKDKLLVKERFFIKNITQVKKYIFETSIKNNISIENLLTVDKEYEQFVAPVLKTNEKSIKVSAIVSTYNSEKFIRGCLEDLVNQTLFKKGEMEIVVVNSGSEQNEDEIINKYLVKYDNIKYIKTEQREGIYTAWNRGIKVAQGKYITNANTDDRHKEDALEILASTLDEKNSIALVYADSKVTDRENEKFKTAHVTGLLLWPEFDMLNLFRICYIGPQPMWRKKLHKKYGYFDGSYKSAGDYDFWLRIAKHERFEHIKEILGLYLLSEDSVEHVNQNISLKESEKARKKNWDSVSDLPPLSGTYLSYYNCSENFPESVKFSIVIPTRDRPEHLRKALQSLTKQTYKDFEVIVINDGKLDILHVLKDFEGQLNYQHVRNVMNRERSASRNNGIKVSRGEYITFLDDDDIFYPNHLQIISDNLSDFNSIVYTDAVRVVYEKTDEGYKKIDKSVPYSIDYERNKLLIGNIAPINCFAIPRKKLFEAGLFNETINVLEDWELLLRLSELTSFKHIKKNTCEVSWRLDGSSTTSSKGYLFDKVRKQIYSKYDKEIKNIPNRYEIVNEFNQIWKNDFAYGSSIVSIIALSFNQFEYTKSFVQSVFKFTKTAFELILVDNGSDKEIVDYLNKLSTKDERIKIIFNEENFGFPKGVNQALKVAKSEYIVIANNDIVVTKNWLERMVEIAKSDSLIGIVAPVSNSVSGVQLDKNAQYSSIKEMHKYAEKIRNNNKGKIYEFPRVAFLCTLIKREVIEKIGGLDERFSPGNYEDDDFCLRAQLAGFKTVIAQDVFIHHYGSKSFKANGNGKYQKLLGINRRKFVDKWGATPDDIWLHNVKPENTPLYLPLEDQQMQIVFKLAMQAINKEYYEDADKYLDECLNLLNEVDNSKINKNQIIELKEKISRMLLIKSNQQ